MLDSCLLVRLSGVEGRFADAKWFDSAHHDPKPYLLHDIGRAPAGRALRFNLFAFVILSEVEGGQKGFPLQSLTQDEFKLKFFGFE